MIDDDAPSTEDVNSAQEQTANTEAAGDELSQETASQGATETAKEAAKIETVPDAGVKKGNPEVEARIAQLTREKHHLGRLAERSAEEAVKAKQELTQLRRPEDYRSDADYAQAFQKAAVDQASAGVLERQARIAHDQAVAASKAAWAEQTAALREKLPDFEAIAENPKLPVTTFMADAIRESPSGGEIAYYLGKNPGEAAKIAALPPVSQVVAIARLEGRINREAAPAQTKAPAPPATLKGSGGASSKSLEHMSFEEYRKARGF